MHLFAIFVDYFPASSCTVFLCNISNTDFLGWCHGPYLVSVLALEWTDGQVTFDKRWHLFRPALKYDKTAREHLITDDIWWQMWHIYYSKVLFMHLSICTINIPPRAYHRHLTSSPSQGVGNLTLELLGGVGNLTPSHGRWGIWPFVHDERRENVKRFSGQNIAFVTEWLTQNEP